MQHRLSPEPPKGPHSEGHQGPQQITGLTQQAGHKGSPPLCWALSPPTALGRATYSLLSPGAGRRGEAYPKLSALKSTLGLGPLAHRWICPRGPDTPSILVGETPSRPHEFEVNSPQAERSPASSSSVLGQLPNSGGGGKPSILASAHIFPKGRPSAEVLPCCGSPVPEAPGRSKGN